MTNKLVYLAGPISGFTYDQSTLWREIATNKLAQNGIKGLSPMRFEHFLKRYEGPLNDCQTAEELEALSVGLPQMNSPMGITVRDRFDCTRCDLMIANLLGAQKVSTGTAIEYGWADANRIPIITIMEPEGNPHEHAILNSITSFRFETLDDGLEAAITMLGVY